MTTAGIDPTTESQTTTTKPLIATLPDLLDTEGIKSIDRNTKGTNSIYRNAHGQRLSGHQHIIMPGPAIQAKQIVAYLNHYS